jgi:hypothetical protein
MASIINAATSGGLISTADTSGILQLQTASTTAVTVNASQNVGIGTSSPSYKLDVSGSGRVTTSFSVGGAPTGYGVLQAISDDANTAPRQISIRGTTNGNKNLFLGFNTTSDYGAIQAIIDGTGTVPLVLQPSGGNLGLGVTPSAWGSNWRAINFGYTSGIGQLAATSGGSGEVSLVSSAYNNNTNWLYYYTGAQASKYSQTSGQHQWFTAGTGTAGNAITFTQAMTLDASGNLGVGTTSPSQRIHGYVASGSIRSLIETGNTSSSAFTAKNSGESVDYGVDSTGGFIQVVGAKPLLFYTNATERARIDSSGNLLVGKTASDVSVAGTQIESTGTVGIVRNAAVCLIVNRLTDDGTLVSLRQASTEEGTISVSGTTVSYNGGHLSRWAQMLTTPELFKGTVMSNLDEMNVYTKDGQPVANEQLNKVKVSDTEGDVNVAGVFVNWSHDEDHNVDEINMAMTGDMIIRIAQGVTVVRGDLLMSAGDGTAKPQGDDIVRSKTVAKVTSNHITCTYADGSYCVPCVLMAC